MRLLTNAGWLNGRKVPQVTLSVFSSSDRTWLDKSDRFDYGKVTG
ncbi:MAG: hypothetical protein ACRDBG_22480 [Waterburya sp.]